MRIHKGVAFFALLALAWGAAARTQVPIRVVSASEWATFDVERPRCVLAAAESSRSDAAVSELMVDMQRAFELEPSVRVVYVPDDRVPDLSPVLWKKDENGSVALPVEANPLDLLNGVCGTSRFADGSIDPAAVHVADGDRAFEAYADGNSEAAISALAEEISASKTYDERYFDMIYYRGLLIRMRESSAAILYDEIRTRLEGVADASQSVLMRREFERNVIVAARIARKLGLSGPMYDAPNPARAILQ